MYNFEMSFDQEDLQMDTHSDQHSYRQNRYEIEDSVQSLEGIGQNELYEIDDSEYHHSYASEENNSEDESNHIDQSRISNMNEIKVFLEEIICPICCNIIVNPKTCRECEQSFCQYCITKWFKGQNKVCPCCRANYYLQNSFNHYDDSFLMTGKVPKLLQKLLSKLLLTCKHEGCQEIITYEYREKHENMYCQYQYIICDNAGCKTELIRKEMEDHKLYCDWGKVNCKYCSKTYFRKDIETHVELCDYRPTKCTYCKELYQWIDVFAHEATCEFRREICDQCGKEFFNYEMKNHTPIKCLKNTADQYRRLFENEFQKNLTKDDQINKQNELIGLLYSQIKELKQQKQLQSENSTQSFDMYEDDFEEEIQESEIEEQIEEDIQIEEDSIKQEEQSTKLEETLQTNFCYFNQLRLFEPQSLWKEDELY